ncbi:hypothetical protein J6590_077259 [Homalodisca vitripennis]|nr:hypothetical protein J6590_077259 [Homalodisca vitripennis]
MTTPETSSLTRHLCGAILEDKAARRHTDELSLFRRRWDCGCTPAPRLRSTVARDGRRNRPRNLPLSRSVVAAEEDDPTPAQHDYHLTGPEMASNTGPGNDNGRTSTSASLHPWTQARDTSQLQRLCSRPLQLAAPSTDTRTRPIRGGAQKCAAQARLTKPVPRT